MPQISAGIDIAKEVHWITAIDEAGTVLIDHELDNDPAAIAALVDELAALDGAVRVGFDVIGGIAGLAEAMLAASGCTLLHVPGLAVNRARQGTVGGENKSDPRDARTIADQVRTRYDLRVIEPAGEIDIELRLLVGRRRDLVQAQTQRIARMRDLLTGIFPALERALDLTTKGPLHLLTRYVTPAELRRAGAKRIGRHLQASRGGAAICAQALACARAQTIAVPGEAMTATLIRELAQEALATRTRLGEIDRDLKERLARHPDAALIQSLPGMGAILTAELIAEAGNLSRFRSPDALAAAAGIAPVLRQSGKTRFLRRPTGGNKGLKRVFYQAAFCSLASPDSRAFYDRKRREGKRHHQAVIALARRRVNVLWAMLQTHQPFQTGFKNAA
ncbi:IS110 family transposase [Altererythrobacter sp. C41]|uniref:IS110 family transposase n=1 Tax=Altererythrobacter sp. C41 TaxID=2806021 RepID=UPI001931C9E1|nr:IS110 family transposase [Altererythrobacter sp. C41]MBM0171314.1 IS110 family transposase [Altererythrobacter sp. C41]